MCEPMHGLGRRGARSGSFLLSAAFLHVGFLVGTWSIFFLVRVHNGVCVPTTGKLIGYLPPAGCFLFRTKLTNITQGFCFLWKVST